MSRRLLAVLLILACMPAQALRYQRQPAAPCDALVEPRQLVELTGYAWLPGGGVWFPGDIMVCNYYPDETPLAFQLVVRPDGNGKDFRAAQARFGTAATPLGDLGQAFFYRVDSKEPFQPFWGVAARAKGRFYRVQGMPEAGDAAGAQKFLRSVLERAMQRF